MEVNMKLLDLMTRARRRAAAIARATQTGLAAFGLLALAFLAFDGARFVPIHSAQAGGMALGRMKSELASQQLAIAAPADIQSDPQRRAVADHLARRYRVAVDAIESLVSEAYGAATATGLDPLLILAVIAVESSFNPIAESDFGAKGLMQIVPRFHLDKLAAHGGQSAILHPGTNILVGAQILRDYIRRAGTLEDGLQLYAGAAEDAAQNYAQKVITERQRLKVVVARVPRPNTAA
jgi:soluble lytic murein transglycosylase-like protein